MKPKHVFLNLFVLDFPVTAISSIIHRITGILLFFSIPFLLYFIYLMLESNSSFIIAKILMSKFYIKLFFNFFIFCFIYHAVNGFKHIVIDLGFFDTKSASRGFTVITLFIILFFIFLSILL